MDVICQLCQRVLGGWDMPAVSDSTWWMRYASCVREFLVDESSWWMGYASCVREFLVDGICQLCQIVLGG